MRGVSHPVSLKGRLKRKSFHGCLASHAALHGASQVGPWELNSTWRRHKFMQGLFLNEKETQGFFLLL